ncbi:flagellin domain-containing protein [Delftia tsuruhatensis]|uniref:flagellin domain-containing protein n=1 Tax=Delftia tsuruhatensis TaxID=180282 RepID=UPI0023DACC88|nr:flagellin domain-containing protein [Delftia tsuruhatensis]WEL98030.1 flagellin domain-containing protein [Delftia tsuruhatensis]WQM83791.1 flagellin domain-containing protein [Delftia tsuruhatensis]
MASIINTNLVSLNAQRNLNTSQSSLSTTMQRLSSGLRVNSAKDDAAGLAIAERMNAQVRGMNVAMRNANDGISMAQTAEGALGKLSENLQRMRELAVQAANDTNGTTDRGSLDKEFKQLSQEIARIVTSTSFNGRQLLNSSSPTVFQVGANTGADNQITISAVDLSDAAALNVDGATTPPRLVGALGSLAGTGSTPTSTAGDARLSMAAIDTALDLVNNTRATFGAAQNRFEAVISNLQVAAENTSAARSRIMDADFAAETANLSRTQILQQAGTAMVAQANQLPQSVLKLIQ